MKSPRSMQCCTTHHQIHKPSFQKTLYMVPRHTFGLDTHYMNDSTNPTQQFFIDDQLQNISSKIFCDANDSSLKIIVPTRPNILHNRTPYEFSHNININGACGSDRKAEDIPNQEQHISHILLMTGHEKTCTSQTPLHIQNWHAPISFVIKMFLFCIFERRKNGFNKVSK